MSTICALWLSLLAIEIYKTYLIKGLSFSTNYRGMTNGGRGINPFLTAIESVARCNDLHDDNYE